LPIVLTLGLGTAGCGPSRSPQSSSEQVPTPFGITEQSDGYNSYGKDNPWVNYANGDVDPTPTSQYPHGNPVTIAP
jgi:hypothetical protein